MKYSKQREMVLQAVNLNKTHPTAEFIYTYIKPQLPTISLATVYRNLNLLTEIGAIRRISMGDGVDRFDGNTTPHHHLYCTSCRCVIDIPAQAHIEIDQADMRERRYIVKDYEVSFYGLCPNCSVSADAAVSD